MESPTLFLCGDVMTGRGIDQILPHPGNPELREPWVHDARDYVGLAEAVNGMIARPVQPLYIWGDALCELERVSPALKIINLETSITTSDEFERGKGINYRMHPANMPSLAGAGIDVCVLANNHVMDFGVSGLRETLAVLDAASVSTAGAGDCRDDAERPAMVVLPGGRRVFVFAFGVPDSGIPGQWAAGEGRAGVSLLEDLSPVTAGRICARVQAIKRPGDIAVGSIHWGGNWGYDVPSEHVEFAHRLAAGGIDVVHGHSSHHPRPVEVDNGRLILYGCGDFLNDYEGIGGYEQYRGDLVLMYFVTLSATGGLVRLDAVPMQIKRMRLTRASMDDAEFVRATLDRISTPFGCRFESDAAGRLCLSPTRQIPA